MRTGFIVALLKISYTTRQLIRLILPNGQSLTDKFYEGPGLVFTSILILRIFLFLEFS